MFGKRIGFTYDNDARMTRMTRMVRGPLTPDSVVETRSYDLLSRLVRRQETMGATVTHSDSLRYDRRDKIRKNALAGDTLVYTALGTLASTSSVRGTESYATDALGLCRTGSGWLARGGRPTTYSYTSGSERLDRAVQVSAGELSHPVADTTYYLRDNDGALREELKARQFQTV